MPEIPNIVKCSHGPGSFIADYTHYPVLIYKWSGAAETQLVDHLYDVHWAYCLRGEPPFSIVLVHDFSALAPFTAVVRKHLADKQASDPYANDTRQMTHPVVPNALIRGVVTAIVWMTGKEKLPLDCVGTMKQGILNSLATLDRWQMERPVDLDPDTYEFPDEDRVEEVFRSS